jgi:hypothetical protein
MALPSLSIGQPVNYFPTYFDAGALNYGQSGRVAALVTYIDTVNNTVDLAVFPAGGEMIHRRQIKYSTDINPHEPFFLLQSDADPACMVDKSGQSITDTTLHTFTASWTNPASYSDTEIYYRVTGTTDWFAANVEGNAAGVFSGLGTDFTFTSGLFGSTEYDILIVNVCPNSIPSAGVIATGTTDADI